VRASDGVASRIDPAVPLVVLSGRAGELDRLRGFERGCDDYVCKPFSYPELRARVEACCAAPTCAAGIRLRARRRAAPGRRRTSARRSSASTRARSSG